MNYNKTLIAIAVATLAAASAQPALAQSATPAVEEKSLRDQIVTANRIGQDLADAPAAVTVVTAKDIEQKNVSRISDALLAVPSLHLEASGNGQSFAGASAGGFTLRGMDRNRTLVLLDGIPVQNSSNNNVEWKSLFVDDVDRVEVVSGAFSSLYGSSAMGGVINMISKDPDKREFTVRLKKGFGDAAGNDASVYFRDKLANGLGITVGLSQANRDGYASDMVLRPVVNTLTAAQKAAAKVVTGATAMQSSLGVPSYLVGDKGDSPWQQTNASIKLVYDLNAQSKIYGGLSYSDIFTDYGPFNTYLRDATGAPVSSGNVNVGGQYVTVAQSNFVTSSPLSGTNKRIFAGYEGVLAKDYKLKLDVSRVDRSDYFTTIGTTATSTALGGPGTQSDNPNVGTDASAQLSFPVGDKHMLVSGLSIHRDTVNRSTFALSNWRDVQTVTFTNDGFTGEATTTSAYVQDEMSVTDKLTVYAGVRADNWSTQGNYFKNTAPVKSETYAERSQTAFSPKLSAVYKPAETVTVRGSYGQSFRTPTLLDLYATTVIASSTSTSGFLTTQSDPNLKPETADAWELGGEWRVNSAMRASATYYDTRINDMIYAKNVNTTLTQRINAGVAQVKGLELGLGFKLASWLELNSNVSWINSEIMSNTADPLSVGKRLTGVPDRIVFVGLTARQGAWTGSVEARYSGQTYVQAQNTDIVTGVPGSRGAFTMVNAKLGYQFNKMVRANLAINNVMDAQVYQFYKMPARNATAELVLSF
jgi:iron complex outermembrane receptor protein